MIRKLLEIIFETGDAESLNEDKDNQFECFLEKFKFCSDLAQSCKLSTQELLRLSSRKIFSQITKILMMNADTICLIDEFIGVEFFKKEILPKAWFHLLKNSEINADQLEKKILEVKYQDDYLIRDSEIKRGLYECLAQTACSKKLTSSQKK